MSSTIRLTRISWGLLMNSFCEHHKGSIRWQYRCFDRILLNFKRHFVSVLMISIARSFNLQE